MKFKCLHGYFIFEELESGEVSDFMTAFGVDLVAKDDYFTFAALADAKDYSIAGGTYLGVPAIKTFEGKPWEIMKQNKLIYDFSSDLVLPIDSVTGSVELKQTTSYFLAPGLIIPGSLSNAVRIKNYSGFYLFDEFKFKYTEISND